MNWHQELVDQTAHLLVGLAACWIIQPSTFAALFLVTSLWAVREHAQHGFDFTSGSARDLVGWLLGGIIYIGVYL